MTTLPVTILLAEDDDGHAQLVQRNLERAGLLNGFLRVRDGRELLDCLASRGESHQQTLGDALVILLDINMPRIDGIEALRQIKADPLTHRVPVIMLTTTDDPREIDRCYELGCNVYITKPVEYDQFIDAIRRLGLFLQIVQRPRNGKERNDGMSTPSQRGNILVLEDDPGIGRLQRLQLERAGYRVELTTNTTEAHARLVAQRVDLLVLDYQLSEPTNGLEFYRSLQIAGRDVPAILVTGYGDETRIIEAMRAGMRDFIPKTPNFIELVAPTVERVMKQVQSERQLMEAEAASRAKDHFIATLSHELRTPLTPVLALVSALQRDARLPQDVQEDMATIYRNIGLEARLIDDMLDITRIARGKLELQFETVDIRPIIEHAIKTCCAHEAAEKMIVCCEELADAGHVARVDPARLTQVFWNVLKNAIKFTPVGGRIFVRTRTEYSADRQWLAVEVEDTGIGIAPEVLPRVFGAFQQGDRTITQQFGGLGLGLAISKAIVEAHGGMIVAASPGPNLGSTFTVQLPVSNSPTAAVEIAPEKSSPSPPERPAEFQQTHLLLVEDHPDTAHVMARMLRRAGFEVTVASNIAQALAETEVARKAVDDSGRCRPIRLVISDLGLPDGTGYELMRKLHGDYRLRGIALSGFGMEEDVKEAAAAGFDRHLTKPVDFEQLLASIRELLGRE